MPPIERLDSRGVLRSDEALNIERVPSSMLIVGGGVIGIEFATLFSGLGTTVTVVEFLPRILSTVDEDPVPQQKHIKRSGYVPQCAMHFICKRGV